MKLVSKHSENKKLVGNVLTIAGQAREAKAKNPNVIDATVGSLYDESGKMLEFSVVNKVIANMTYAEKYSYSTTDGGALFASGIMKWTLRGNYEEVLSKMHCRVVATPGGTGAISSTMANYLNPGDTILIPHICWGPYSNMAYEHFCKVETYQMFDENDKFNLKQFKEKIASIKEKQGRVYTIINDPCQNPTGYFLSDEEWDEIIDYINEISKDVPFILVYDMAYIDYSHKGIDGSRDVFKKFTRFNENVMVVSCFSGSKTFSLYGLRIGAAMCITKSKEASEDFFYATEYMARSSWSNTAKLGVSLVGKLMNDEDLTNEFLAEIKKSSQMLLDRSNLFLKEANDIGLKMYPYKSGFFVTIPCDGFSVYERLKAKDIHVVPFKNAIRISLSAISLKEIKGLAQKLAQEL